MKAEDTFLPWLKRAKPGDTHVYYTGIAASRAPKVSCEGVLGHVALADLAWMAHKLGLVYLVQRRVASHKFDYIAVRSGRPFEPLALAYDPEPAIA
jgi:hypothetical protein